MTPRNPKDMKAAVAASMEARTGRTVDEWVGLVRESGIDPRDQNAVRRWLKTEHGVGQNSQWAIADAAARNAGWVPPTLEEYVDQQYAGPKTALRPVFDRLREIMEALGSDVRAEGRKTYVPFIRRRQFAAIAAAARNRVDVGLRYTDPPSSALLRPANAPGQATHRISLRSVQDIDHEVEHLIAVAYEQNA